MAGSLLVWGIYKHHFDATKDSLLQLAAFSTGPAIRHKFSNILSEIVGTFVLVFVIFYVSNPVIGIEQEETPIGLGSLGAVPVTLLVFAIGLSLGGTTGYAINPARDFGPRIVHSVVPMKNKCKSDWGYAWIPILGPIIGAAMAAVTYLILS
jgi:glycerol uptake facilitator protein